MKGVQVSIAVFLFILISNINEVHADTEFPSANTYTDASAMYVPTGFDDNDNVQVVIEGMYADGCYQWRKSHVDIDDRMVIIYPRAYYPKDMNIVCPQVMIPFKETVNLGELAAGRWEVFVFNSEGTHSHKQILNIKEATTIDQDDFSYAPVTEVKLIRKSPYTVRLNGEWPHSCAFMENVHVMEPIKNVVSLLPKANYSHMSEDIFEGSYCAQVRTPFEIDVVLDHPGLEGRMLIHVRSQNGQAINKIADF